MCVGVFVCGVMVSVKVCKVCAPIKMLECVLVCAHVSPYNNIIYIACVHAHIIMPMRMFVNMYVYIYFFTCFLYKRSHI